MAKRTAVIDIGSNSARMIVFEKSSHFAFHLIKEIKSRVRISEGAYEFDNVLLSMPMQRTFDALEDFNFIIKNLKCTKIFCIATSALRDAPNAKDFIKRVKKELNLNIKIIDGNKEAYYGALSSINLLEHIQNATTIDIGGGSTELAKIENGIIKDVISINLGTVRLKELFFDKNNYSFDSINQYINDELKNIPYHFKNDIIIGIGGTLRSLSQTIMDKIHYPLETVHSFKYEINQHEDLIKKIISSDIQGLKQLGIKKDRYDTIREGSHIFYAIKDKLGSKQVITNGAGIREGIYLHDLLRANNSRFPHNFSVSLKSLSDRFIDDEKDSLFINKTAIKLFDALTYIHQINPKYKKEYTKTVVEFVRAHG